MSYIINLILKLRLDNLFLEFPDIFQVINVR